MKSSWIGWDVVIVWLFILVICIMALFGCVPPSECRRMMTEAYWQGKADTQIECNRAIANQKIFFENQDRYIEWMKEKELKTVSPSAKPEASKPGK